MHKQQGWQSESLQGAHRFLFFLALKSSSMLVVAGAASGSLSKPMGRLGFLERAAAV